MRYINGHEMKKVHVASIVIATEPYSTKTHKIKTQLSQFVNVATTQETPLDCVYMYVCVGKREEKMERTRERELCVLVAAEERRNSSGTVACVSCVKKLQNKILNAPIMPFLSKRLNPRFQIPV